MVVRAVVSLEATVFWYERTIRSCPPAKRGLAGGQRSNPRLTPAAGCWQEKNKRIRGEFLPRTGPPELADPGDSFIAVLCGISHSD